ncbi:unnamed protein product [Citrullus colocynthis]|uniref:Uncharacterized protein n=1 Tax=Citrullus colocynthis TaxID=252529 RepID=A0ABP0XKT9_9ROSI
MKASLSRSWTSQALSLRAINAPPIFYKTAGFFGVRFTSTPSSYPSSAVYTVSPPVVLSLLSSAISLLHCFKFVKNVFRCIIILSPQCYTKHHTARNEPPIALINMLQFKADGCDKGFLVGSLPERVSNSLLASVSSILATEKSSGLLASPQAAFRIIFDGHQNLA